ncbi:MAG: alpha/beta hydrolase [Pseudomonadales bacterium]|nr:alpha/beta hydrolase [Pseudomonadales bacterium]MBO6703189.1 alpha/beta hydrolase [Pseudomonadales bacterium]MBO7006194.1 alpha/beta hydrolase [Pseudomonadales bacterium]
MRWISLFLLLVLPLGNASAELAMHSVRADGSQITYYLQNLGDTPILEDKPLLLFFHGSDCNSIVNMNSMVGVARDLPILLIEKYGITADLPYLSDEGRSDCPKDYLVHNSISQRVLDALSVLSQLQKTASWWNGNIVIVGGSVGSNVASQLASIYPDTKALIIFSFGSRRFETDLMSSIESSFGDVDGDIRDAELSKVRSLFQEMKDNPTQSKFASGHSYSYWSELLRFDSLATLSQVNAPILAVQGGNDTNVSATGAKKLVESLRKRGMNNVEFLRYEDLDHGYLDQDGNSRLDIVIEDMSSWLSSILESAT